MFSYFFATYCQFWLCLCYLVEATKKGPCVFNGKLYRILFREICLARWPMWATPPARIILPCRGKGYGVLNVFTVIPLSPQAPVFVVIHFCNLFWWLSGGGTMWIQIRTIDGKETRTIEDLSRLTKIESLRLKIQEIFNVNPGQQRLFYRGKQVDVSPMAIVTVVCLRCRIKCQAANVVLNTGASCFEGNSPTVLAQELRGRTVVPYSYAVIVPMYSVYNVAVFSRPVFQDACNNVSM